MFAADADVIPQHFRSVAGHFALETFVPLYITNRCDAVCTICGMRRGNTALKRIGIDLRYAVQQLEIIRCVEGISAVCFLTGEYRRGDERHRILDSVLTLVTTAFAQGYEKIYINVGGLHDDEILAFKKHFQQKERLVLSLFQETYDRDTYRRFFGKKKAWNPKGDFDLRLSTPTRWLDAGFRCVDIGVLVGLSPLGDDLDRLVVHARELHRRGADVAVSLPRIRGVEQVPCPVDDEAYCAAIRYVAEACPWAKLILTTRESVEFIRQMLPYLRIVSPGTSEVMPYTMSGVLSNRADISQFVVAETRPRPSWVLNSLGLPVGSIQYYAPRGGTERRE